MKITFNPSTVAALTTPPNNKDITFDLRGRNIFARGVKFYGTDTNTWRDIKINNVSIGSHTLDLQNGSNTTLTNTNGVVTINSTWRPVVDNLTSDSTTSSLSAKQGKVLKALIDGKSNSDHNHDGRYLRLSGQDTMQGNLYLHSYGNSYIGKGLGDKSGADFTEANIVIRSWWGISFKANDNIVRTYIDTRTGNIGTKGVLNAVGAVIQGRVYNGGDDEGIIINPASNGNAGLILGTHNGERSVFYLKKGNPFWRYNNGSTNLDIQHPKKPGVIALTSDIPSKDSWNYDDRYLRLTGGWMSGNINFGGDNKIYWGRNTDSASISFKNDGDGDANSYMSFVTSDNGNEYFRWSHSSGSTNTEWMALRSDGLRVRGTKVSLEGHSHNDLYYTKAESNAKYITDITTSVNKLTFTRNGSNIIRDITVNVVHSQGHLTNIPNKDATTKASPGLLIYNSQGQTIGTNLYSSVLSINTGGTIQIAGNWGDDSARNLYWRSQSDRNVADYPWKSWRTVLDSSNYTEFINNYYWANVKISASSSTTTSPTVHTLTATRVCAGHNPGIDNSISCSNWFRSSGNTGWYNTTYYGGWYMSDTSWIRAHNGVGIYTSGQIYSSSSIRMSNILLEHTDEINNSANGDIHLNYRNSGNVSLCYGGGYVGIGTPTPSYKLDVNGQMRASGFHHSSVNSDNYILLAGGGYKTLEDFIFLNKSNNYTDNEHYNLAFHKLSGFHLVWVDGHVKGAITKNFAIDPAFFPYRYDNDPDLNTIYLMTGNSSITINAIGVVTINNATNHKQRVGFFYMGRA